MVDALHRISHLLRHDGALLDVHPTAEEAHVEIAHGGQVTTVGDVRTLDGPARHAAADAALERAVARGILVVERTCEFSFRSHGSIEDLASMVANEWRSAAVPPEVIAAVGRTAVPGDEVWIRERVRATRLRPAALTPCPLCQ
ncbi:MAG: hypothetical protein U0Q12_07430 [Vicinamibacterales bacterium]